MKTKLLALLSLGALILSGCNIKENSNAILSSESGSESSGGESSSSSGSGSSSSSGSSEETSGSEESSSSEEPPIGDETDLGVKTIAEVKALCQEYVTSTNEAGLGFNNTYKVTIGGIAIDHFSLRKITSPYNTLPMDKTIIADETGYIACSSGDLMSSASNYTKQRKSYYSITGKLSLYMGIPELYVVAKGDYSYDSSKSLSESMKAFSISKGEKSVSELYSQFKTMSYNFSGYGYGDIYTLNNLKILEKNSGSNNYVATDGHRMLKLVCYNNLSVGTIYNFAGMISTVSWQPALRCLGYQIVTDENIKNNFPNEYKTTAVQDITVANFKKIKSSQNETAVGYRMDSFIESFQYMYKAHAYVNYWLKSSKYQLSISDSYFTGSITSDEKTAHVSQGKIDFDNENYCGDERDVSYASVYDYVNENTAIDIYFTPWQCDFIKGNPIWQIYHITETMPIE